MNGEAPGSGGQAQDEEVFEFRSELWMHRGGSWYFTTLPTDIADDIEDVAGERAGFGSIPVVVTIGASTWTTSLFPDKGVESFVLPVKKSIRTTEDLEDGSPIEVRLTVDRERS